MPIYEYLCGTCNHVFESMQKINDKPLTICPKCYASNVKRQVSVPSFQLKGTGWYHTDYKNQSKPQSGESTHTKTPSKSDSNTNEGQQ